MRRIAMLAIERLSNTAQAAAEKHSVVFSDECLGRLQ
jgi:hypothetical protein